VKNTISFLILLYKIQYVIQMPFCGQFKNFHLSFRLSGLIYNLRFGRARVYREMGAAKTKKNAFVLYCAWLAVHLYR
jgi:hypothetical protein